MKKVIFSAVVVFLAIGVLVYTVIDDSLSYYITVEELLADTESNYGESLRVAGTVVAGSIEKDAEGAALRFEIVDDAQSGQSLPVLYEKEISHDDLEAGKELVAKGEYRPDGVFHADKLVMKCASKYEAAD